MWQGKNGNGKKIEQIGEVIIKTKKPSNASIQVHAVLSCICSGHMIGNDAISASIIISNTPPWPYEYTIDSFLSFLEWLLRSDR